MMNIQNFSSLLSLNPIFICLPLTFIFLWALITGDFKNFSESKFAYMKYTAKNPIDCYLSYKPTQDDNS